MTNTEFKTKFLAALIAASVATPVTCDVDDHLVTMTYRAGEEDAAAAFYAGVDAGLLRHDNDSETSEISTDIRIGGHSKPIAIVHLVRVPEGDVLEPNEPID